MRTITLAVVLGAVLATGSSAVAQTSFLVQGPNVQADARRERALELLRGKMAQLPGADQPVPRPFGPFVVVPPGSADTPAAGAPHVVCGMTVRPVDPKLDAAIRKVPPQDPKPTIRVQPAPSCEQRR